MPPPAFAAAGTRHPRRLPGRAQGPGELQGQAGLPLRPARRHRRGPVPGLRRHQAQEDVRQGEPGGRAQHLPDRRRRAPAPGMARGQGQGPCGRGPGRAPSPAGRLDLPELRSRSRLTAATPTDSQPDDQARARQALPLRPRHQRADARPHRHLPLPGTRHLPADGGAGGTGRGQEGHVRGRPQRPPGQPLPGPPDADADKDEIDAGLPGQPHRRRTAAGASLPATGRLFFQTEHLRPQASPRPCPGPARTTTSSVPPWPCGNCGPTAQVIIVSKDINLRIKAAVLGIPAEDYSNDQVLDDAALLYTGHGGPAGGLLGAPREGHGLLEGGGPHLLPRQRARTSPTGIPANASTWARTARFEAMVREKRTATEAVIELVDGLPPDPPQRLGHQRAQPRAELCAEHAAWTRSSTSSPCSAPPGPARPCSPWPRAWPRCWTATSTTRSS